MNLKITGSLVLMGAALALACGSSRQADQAAPAAKPAAANEAAKNPASIASGDFGVPECDQYMKKYLACIDAKVPDATKATLKQAFDQAKSSWKQAASTPEGRAALATSCTQAEAAAKQAMQAYGCQW